MGTVVIDNKVFQSLGRALCHGLDLLRAGAPNVPVRDLDGKLLTVWTLVGGQDAQRDDLQPRTKGSGRNNAGGTCSTGA